jgi:hypothetical protein
MAQKEPTNPASALWQADVLSTGFLPNDSMIGEGGNIAPTIDYAAPITDGVEAFDEPPPPPPGSIANHVHIGDPDGNTLSGSYSMLGD